MDKNRKTRIVWACPYPIHKLPETNLVRSKTYHPAPWIVNMIHFLSQVDVFEIHLVTLSAHIKSDQSFKKNGITFHIIKRGIKFLNVGYPKWFRIDLFSFFYRDTNKIKKTVNRLKPDLVHGFGTEVPYALAVTKCSCPSVITLQGIMHEMYKRNKWNINFLFMSKIEKMVLLRSNYFISQSEYVSNYIKKINSNANVFETKYIVDKNFYNVKREKKITKTILFVGSILDKNKGFDLLLDAYVKLCLQGYDYKLLIIGSKYEYSITQKKYLLNNHDIIKNIQFLGRKSHSEIAEFYKTGTLLVVPSLFETYSMTVAEGLISGIPVIASDTGGIPSLIDDNINGLLFNLKNSNSLFDKLLFAVKNPVKMLDISNKARERALKEFDPTAIIEYNKNYYLNIINEKCN